MTATSERRTHDEHPPMSAGLRPAALVPPRGRRRPALVVAGMAMVALGALAVAWLVGSAGHRTDVVVMARDVPYGAALTADDLSTTAVSVDPVVAVVPANEASGLVGMVATTNLTRGSLLTQADLATGGLLGSDQVLVPLPLSVDRIPARGLSAGDRLLVVDAPPQGADPIEGAPATFEVRVAYVGSPDVNGTVVVDAIASAKDGPRLATRAATGRFAIVVEPAQVSP